MTMEGVPSTDRDDMAASPEELAAHSALTLFAVHQQSRDAGMHQPGVGLGQAVARLERQQAASSGEVAPIRRRFDAVITAQSVGEAIHHLRSIIQQLRVAGIPLDYGSLADDLVAFQNPHRADSVRRRWARQMYFHHETPTTDSLPSDEPKED
jgi:CRISPR system Cascade subunit CasB